MPQITQNFIPGLPHYPYDKGYGGYIGVAAHSTGNYGGKLGDNAISEREWEIQTWGSAFVHFFCDHNGILQVADINYKAFGAGKNANGKYVHVELCQTHEREKFLKGYANYVWTLAYVLFKKNLPVVEGKTLVSHQWISKNLGGTDHQDPMSYLAEHGKTWGDVVKDTTAQYNRLKAPVVPNITVDQAVEFICKKIKSVDDVYWKKIAHTLQYFDIMVTKIATAWGKETPVTNVSKLPPVINMTLDEALNFIDSKVHLSDPAGWRAKAKSVQFLELFFIKVAYVWRREGQKK